MIVSWMSFKEFRRKARFPDLSEGQASWADLPVWPEILASQNRVVKQFGIDAAKTMTVARDSSTNAANEAHRPGLSCFLKPLMQGLIEIEWGITELSPVGFR